MIFGMLVEVVVASRGESDGNCHFLSRATLTGSGPEVTDH